MRRLHDTAARAALESSALVVPARPSTFPDGPVAEIRDQMARFSEGDEHADRRADVEAAIADVDVSALSTEVLERTRAALQARPSDVERIDALSDIGMVVPTLALLAALGVEQSEVARRAADVGLIVASIGRGAAVTADTDAAARRLLAEFATHSAGPVAAISMLYQNHDATAALFGSVLLARATGETRHNALARTVRVALEPTTVIDADVTDADVIDAEVTAGEVVEVSLDGEDVEFGAGRHACPGERLAVAIVDAMIAAIDGSEFTVDIGDVALGDDQRPTALPLSS